MREKTHTSPPDSAHSPKAPRHAAGNWPLLLAGVAAATLALILIATVARLAGPPLLERLAAPDAPAGGLQQAVRAELRATPTPTATPAIATPLNHDGGR